MPPAFGDKSISIGWTVQETVGSVPVVDPLNLILLPPEGIIGTGVAVEGDPAPVAETFPVKHEGGQGASSAGAALAPLKAVTKTSSAQSDAALERSISKTINCLLADKRANFLVIKGCLFLFSRTGEHEGATTRQVHVFLNLI